MSPIFNFQDFPACESLRSLGSFFDQLGCDYWVDSGTLLMISRGDHIPLDDDFDISAVVSDELADTVRDYVLGAYKNVKISKFDGRVFKLKIYHESGILIDLNLFRVVNGLLCCPQKTRPPFWNYIPYFVKAVAKLGASGRESQSQHSTIVLESGKWTYAVSTWLVPKRYIGSGRLCEVTGLRIPEFTEEYLEFRYRDWKVPVASWSFDKDDSGLTYLSTHIIERIRHSFS